MEEEQKRMIADAAERGMERKAQYRNILRVVAPIAFIALVALVIDMMAHDAGDRLPMDLSDPEGTITEWERLGFVKSINASEAAVIVDEVVWSEISSDEKTSLIAFLASYCEEKRGAEEAMVTIRGHPSHKLLGRLDSVGISID